MTDSHTSARNIRQAADDPGVKDAFSLNGVNKEKDAKTRFFQSTGQHTDSPRVLLIPLRLKGIGDRVYACGKPKISLLTGGPNAPDAEADIRPPNSIPTVTRKKNYFSITILPAG